MVSTNDVVLYSASGLIGCGIVSNAAASLLFTNSKSISSISRENGLIWAPRNFLGAGDAGNSPIYGIMWGFVYFTSALSVVVTLIYSAMQNLNIQYDSEADAFFNSSALSCSAFLVAAVWGRIFSINKKWSFVVSSCLLLLAALFAVTAAVVNKAFLVTELKAYQVINCVAISFFAGWICVAASLGVGITTRVYNRGIGKHVEEDDTMFSVFPLVLSILLSIVSILFAIPILPLPLFMTTFFMKKFRKWYVWGTALVSGVSICVSVGMIFLYRSSGVFW